jgi:hypothetical protein
VSVFSGTTTVGPSPTPICTIGQDGALVFTSSSGVFIGGPNVAVSGPNAGIPLPSSQYVTVPGAAARALPLIGAGMDTAILYGIVASSTAPVSWLTAATGSGT